MDRLSAKSSLRVLRFLKKAGRVRISDFGDKQEKRVLLTGAGDNKILCQRSVVDGLHKASLVELLDGHCRIVEAGGKRLSRAEAVLKGDLDGGFATQHRDLAKQTIVNNNATELVTINRNESPLARLKARKAADGQPWISDAAFQAGERLRGDYTRSHLMQNITMNWDIGTPGGRSSSYNGKADIMDSASDARIRLERALECVGPELAGLVTDVCCFLKGLESVERERRWPPRSAKLMLRTALNLLARHYGTLTGQI